MKVALIVPGGVDRSGTERVIPCLLWLIERLARAHEVHVFALQQEPRRSRYRLLGAEVHNIGVRPRRTRALAAILAEHRRAPFDVLHAVWGPGPGVVAAAAGRLTGRPVVTHLTGGDLVALPEIGYGARSRWQGRLWLRLAVAGASRLTVPSLAMQRAAAALRDLGIVFRLDIVGEDTLGGEVQRLARTLGLDDVVVFHGFLPHRELRALVEAAHVLLVSSRHEADPMVMLEAAVVGVPTVGTAVGHIGDWAPDAAIVVPVGDAAALAHATAALLADEPRRLRTAGAAQARALAEDADWTARRVVEIYQELTDRAPVPRGRPGPRRTARVLRAGPVR
jgi:glycosyltransferase involved in cell wall biosynthesis